jgi:hypothetical protein
MPLIWTVVNADTVATRIGKAIGHITYFAGVEMPREMSQWQTEDMHRKRPATKKSKWRSHHKSVSTIIRPHSRYETERSRKFQQGLRRRLKRRKRPSADQARLRFSTRPILREVLHQRFIERMQQALGETVKW